HTHTHTHTHARTHHTHTHRQRDRQKDTHFLCSTCSTSCHLSPIYNAESCQQDFESDVPSGLMHTAASECMRQHYSYTHARTHAHTHTHTHTYTHTRFSSLSF